MATMLDDPGTYRSLDPSQMEQRIAALPGQCMLAWEASTSLKLPMSYRKVRNVVVAGMGGSAIGGALVSDLASLEESVPIAPCRDYRVPGWIDQDTLVVISSHSGNTEETISAFHSAVDTQAKVAVMASGGRLSELAREEGVPTLQTPGDGEPRSSIGYSFLGLLGLLCSLDIVADKSADVAQAVEVVRGALEEWRATVPFDENEAKRLAAKLQGRIVILWGSGILSGVARRWKTQLNENAKTMAFFETLPEAGHNSIEGYRFPAGTVKEAFVVLLRSPHVSPRILAKYDVIGKILEGQGIRHEKVNARGESPLSHVLSLVLLGDYVSYYLALLNGVDPSPTENLDTVKSQIGLTSAG